MKTAQSRVAAAACEAGTSSTAATNRGARPGRASGALLPPLPFASATPGDGAAPHVPVRPLSAPPPLSAGRSLPPASAAAAATPPQLAACPFAARPSAAPPSASVSVPAPQPAPLCSSTASASGEPRWAAAAVLALASCETGAAAPFGMSRRPQSSAAPTEVAAAPGSPGSRPLPGHASGARGVGGAASGVAGAAGPGAAGALAGSLGLRTRVAPRAALAAAPARGRLSARRRPGHSSAKGSAAERLAAAARSSFSARTICAENDTQTAVEGQHQRTTTTREVSNDIYDFTIAMPVICQH